MEVSEQICLPGASGVLSQCTTLVMVATKRSLTERHGVRALQLRCCVCQRQGWTVGAVVCTWVLAVEPSEGSAGLHIQHEHARSAARP